MLSMLGHENAPELRLHGSKTNGIVRFTNQSLLPNVGAALGSRRIDFTAAVKACATLLGLIRTHPRCMQTAVVQRFVDEVLVLHRSLENLQIPLKPKFHFLLELGCRLETMNIQTLTWFKVLSSMLFRKNECSEWFLLRCLMFGFVFKVINMVLFSKPFKS